MLSSQFSLRMLAKNSFHQFCGNSARVMQVETRTCSSQTAGTHTPLVPSKGLQDFWPKRQQFPKDIEKTAAPLLLSKASQRAMDPVQREEMMDTKWKNVKKKTVILGHCFHPLSENLIRSGTVSTICSTETSASLLLWPSKCWVAEPFDPCQATLAYSLEQNFEKRSELVKNNWMALQCEGELVNQNGQIHSDSTNKLLYLLWMACTVSYANTLRYSAPASGRKTMARGRSTTRCCQSASSPSSSQRQWS